MMLRSNMGLAVGPKKAAQVITEGLAQQEVAIARSMLNYKTKTSILADMNECEVWIWETSSNSWITALDFNFMSRCNTVANSYVISTHVILIIRSHAFT